MNHHTRKHTHAIREQQKCRTRNASVQFVVRLPGRALAVLVICIFHTFHSGYRLTGSLANIKDPDEMPHDAAFHQVLHCMLNKNNL